MAPATPPIGPPREKPMAAKPEIVPAVETVLANPPPDTSSISERVRVSIFFSKVKFKIYVQDIVERRNILPWKLNGEIDTNHVFNC